MIPYYIALFVALIFALIADKEKGLPRNICIIFSLLPFLVLAWLRDDRVGADTAAYPFNWFMDAQSFSSYIDYIENHPVTEPLYGAFAFFSFKIFPQDFNSFLLLNGLIFCSSVFYISKYLKKSKVPIWFTIVMLFLLLYMESLNWARQYIAISILIFSFKFLVEKKCAKFLLCILIAEGFHSAAFVVLILYPFYVYFPKFNLWKLELMIVFAIIVSYVFFQNVLSTLIDYAILYEKYDRYIDQKGYSVHKVDLIQNSVIVIYLLFSSPQNIKEIKQRKILIGLFSFCIGLLLLGSLFETASRVELYFVVPAMLSFYTYLIRNEKKKILYCVFFIIIMSLGWIYVGLVDPWDTYRYSSKILGV